MVKSDENEREKSLQQLTKKELAKELLFAGLEGLLTGGAMRPPKITVKINLPARTTNGSGTTNGGESKPK